MRVLLFLMVAGGLLFSALPADAPAREEAVKKETETQVRLRLRKEVEGVIPGAKVSSLKPSPLEDFYSVVMEDGKRFLLSRDGGHMMVGDLYSIRENGLFNLSEKEREGWRREKLAAVPPEALITFSPREEKRESLYVFTDVDCGYCRRLHQEMPELNALGIEVRYLAYPRGGIGTPTYTKMVSAWCAKNSHKALTTLKQGGDITPKLCVNNPVAQQYRLGSQMGVTGTPALITGSGELIRGYLPAKTLARRLGLQ